MSANDTRRARLWVWVLIAVVIVIGVAGALFAYTRPSTITTPGTSGPEGVPGTAAR